MTRKQKHEAGRARVLAMARASRLSSLTLEQRRANAYRKPLAD